MLSLIVFLPLAAGLLLLAVPQRHRRTIAGIWVAAAAVDLGLVVTAWLTHPAGGGMVLEERLRWLPSVGAGYHIGVDGLSLPLVAVTAGLFLAAAIASVRQQHRPRTFAVLFLFLQTVSLGVFVALDLLVFFVFFDLSIVGMYFVIAGWGHAGARKAALQFFLYTFSGSLVLLLGFIGLYLGASPHTFDMVELARSHPFANQPLLGAAVLLAIGVGLAIKVPSFPFHTWLPPAHTEAPTAGSVILAGVMLKMGTWGLVRIAIPILPDAWRGAAWVVVVVGVVSVLYGALVALAQTDLKRMIAYTSVNHMGYILLGLGAAGLAPASSAGRAEAGLAISGSVTQMVSHGLLTGALFLLAGVVYERGGSYRMADYGGLADPAPRFAAALAVAAFGSLGLPALSGFIAEFQIFTGSFGPAPVATGVALLGILITAALFLRMLQRLLTGRTRLPQGRAFPDLRPHELSAVGPLLAVAIAIGVYPPLILDTIGPAAGAVAAVLAP